MHDLRTEILEANPMGFRRAAAIWRAGGLVALPTETVYGLGADACNDLAVARIFEAKGRPRFNPLIVHVTSIAQAQKLVHWTDAADRLASAFWPGPLTLVLPVKQDAGLSPLVTADLPTLAVRVPANPVAQKVLAEFGGPIAAPSANPSGKISPTSARHVIAGLSGKIEAVLDGATCDVGLESTIIGLSDTPTLLRPGGLPLETLEGALGQVVSQHTSADPLIAPGQMTSHYAPGAQVRLHATSKSAKELLLGFGPTPPPLSSLSLSSAS